MRGGPDGPRGRRSGRRRLCVAVVLALALAACDAVAELNGPAFAVGDCVTLTEGFGGTDLEPADCDDAVGSFDPSARTYKIDAIIDLGASCEAPQGFFPVSLAHEPDGVTYCMSQAG